MMIDEYSLLKCVGKGSFGEVYLTSKIGSNQFYATKKVSKQKADSPAIKKYFINEITILKEINHPNIIHFEAIKHTIHNYYIITEFCNGGGLSDCLKKYMNIYGRAFPEEIVQYLMRQIVEALKYLHGKRIIHRDIKLDNILVNFDNSADKNSLNMLKAKVKIIDFGFATHLGASNQRFSTLGSPINMDPILLKKLTSNKATANLIGYDEKADIWSLGTVCYELLIGTGVFNAETMVGLIKKVEYGDYHVPTNLSREVVSFLNGMLQYSSRNRLSAEELSRHHFLTKNIKDFKHIDLNKVCHKIDDQGININIKRNQSIWAIFKEEDEKALINIPGKYLMDLTPISEQDDEYSQISHTENPFQKASNTTSNNNNNNINPNNINTNNQVIKPGTKEVDYNLLKQQQKLYYNINHPNNNNVNYVHNNQYGLGTANAYTNYTNYYANGQQKFYNANLNAKKNPNVNVKINVNGQINPQPAIQTVQTANNIVYQVPQTNNQLLLNQQQQYQILNTNQQQYQYVYGVQPQIIAPNAQKVQIPVASQKQVIIQGYNTQTNPTPQTTLTSYQTANIQNQNIKIQNPVIITDKNNKNNKNNLGSSKISAISSATTKTEALSAKAKLPKAEDNYYKMVDLETYQEISNYPNKEGSIDIQIIPKDSTYKEYEAKIIERPKKQQQNSPTYIQQNQTTNIIEEPKVKQDQIYESPTYIQENQITNVIEEPNIKQQQIYETPTYIQGTETTNIVEVPKSQTYEAYESTNYIQQTKQNDIIQQQQTYQTYESPNYIKQQKQNENKKIKQPQE